MSKTRILIVLAAIFGVFYTLFRWWLYEFLKFIDGVPTEENP